MNPVAPVTKTLVPLKNFCISLIDSSPLVIVLFFFSPIYKMINLTSLHKSKANITDLNFNNFFLNIVMHLRKKWWLMFAQLIIEKLILRINIIVDIIYNMMIYSVLIDLNTSLQPWILLRVDCHIRIYFWSTY